MSDIYSSSTSIVVVILNEFVMLLLWLCSVHDLCNKRKTALEESRKYYQFLEDSELEEAWLVEKSRAMKSQDVGKDLAACNRLLMKHQVPPNSTNPTPNPQETFLIDF